MFGQTDETVYEYDEMESVGKGVMGRQAGRQAGRAAARHNTHAPLKTPSHHLPISFTTTKGSVPRPVDSAVIHPKYHTCISVARPPSAAPPPDE